MRMVVVSVAFCLLAACQPPFHQSTSPSGSIRLEAHLPPPKTGFTTQDTGLSRLSKATVEVSGFGIPSPIVSASQAVTLVAGVPTLSATFTGIPEGKNRVVMVRGLDSREFPLPGIEVGGVIDVPTSGTVTLNRQTTAAARLYLDLLRLAANSDTKNLLALMANVSGENLANLVQRTQASLGLIDPDQLDLVEVAKAIAQANQGQTAESFFDLSPKLPAVSSAMKAQSAALAVKVNAPPGIYRLAYSDRLSAPLLFGIAAGSVAFDSEKTLAGTFPANHHALTFEKLNVSNEVVSRLSRQGPVPRGVAMPVRPLRVSPEQAPIGATVTIAVDETVNPTGTDGPYFGSGSGRVVVRSVPMAVSKWSDRSVQFIVPPSLEADATTYGVTVTSADGNVTGEVLGLFRVLAGAPTIRKVVESAGSIFLQGENFSEVEDDHVVTYTPAGGSSRAPQVTPIGSFPVETLSFPGTLQRGDTLRVSIGGIQSNLFRLNWLTRATLNTSRFDFSCTAVSSRLYAFGGRTSGSVAGDPVTSVETFNPATNSWSSLGAVDDLPASLSGKTGAAVTADINADRTVTSLRAFVFGDTDMFRFDPSATAGSRWSGSLASTSTRLYLGMAAINAGSAADEWKVYLIGGHSGAVANALATVGVFDVNSGTLSTLPTASNLSSARFGLAAVAANGKIYAVGGYDSSNVAVKKFDVFDPATGTWTALPDLPTARGDVRAIAIGDEIFVTGGMASGQLQDLVEVYNLSTNSWRTAAPMGLARRAHGLAAVGNKFYAFGGREAIDNATTAGSVFAANEEYDSALP